MRYDIIVLDINTAIEPINTKNRGDKMNKTFMQNLPEGYYINNVIERKVITKEQALDIIQHHGINSFHTQTGCINGEMCEFGTSFAEQVGIRNYYTLQEVKYWLGY